MSCVCGPCEEPVGKRLVCVNWYLLQKSNILCWGKTSANKSVLMHKLLQNHLNLDSVIWQLQNKEIHILYYVWIVYPLCFHWSIYLFHIFSDRCWKRTNGTRWKEGKGVLKNEENRRCGWRSRSEGVTDEERGREKRRIERQQDQTHCLLFLQCSIPSFSWWLQAEINR